MTKVTFVMDNQIKYIGFIIVGHTGYSIQGEDILCAAVSMVSQSVLTGIIHVIGADAEVSINAKEALMSMLVLDSDVRMVEDADLLIRTMHQSLMAIESEYSKYLEVEILDVADTKYSELWQRLKTMREVEK